MPRLQNENEEINLELVPLQIKVRPELSKIRLAYFTFLALKVQSTLKNIWN
jgi:hypothetical protein